MKKILLPIFLVVPLLAAASNWDSYPIVTAPNSSDTFLIGTATTNEQISAGNLFHWPNIVPIWWTNQGNFLAGLGGSNIVASAFMIPTPHEYWIGTNNAGLNLGTLSDPLIASNQWSFDTIMSNLCQQTVATVIHFLPGRYQTYGSEAWKLRSNFSLEGSGQAQTTLQYINPNTPTYNTQVISSGTEYGSTHNITVKDMTLDCNGDGSNNWVGAIVLAGYNHVIENVTAINESGRHPDHEQIAIYINGYNNPPPDLNGITTLNLISGCTVSNVVGTYSDGIGISGENGIIENCRVILPKPMGTNQAFFAYGFSLAKNNKLLNSYAYGGNASYRVDTGNCTNVLISGNTFLNAIYGVWFHSPVNKNITVENNFISLSTNNPGQGIYFGSGTTDFNVILSKNIIECDTTNVTVSTYGIASDGRIVDIICSGNIVSSNLVWNTAKFNGVSGIVKDNQNDAGLRLAEIPAFQSGLFLPISRFEGSLSSTPIANLSGFQISGTDTYKTRVATLSSIDVPDGMTNVWIRQWYLTTNRIGVSTPQSLLGWPSSSSSVTFISNNGGNEIIGSNNATNVVSGIWRKGTINSTGSWLGQINIGTWDLTHPGTNYWILGADVLFSN